ncbi:hypothetical protein [Lentzea sp. CC55]|uniref:hypothetical protein n=1 Tax=Lentzea sp. CC55 TaxID=2884909 RepID=UPI0027E0C35C|nr:hypothetical protein [Lentzea sp. CC55]
MGLLEGRVALVTGVSRRQGIGYAIASRLRGLGAEVFVQHHVPHDAAQPWGADSVDEVLAGIGAQGLGVDLADPAGPERLVAAAVEAFGASTCWCATTRGPAATGRWPRWTPRCSTGTTR